jgi:hypothetical protein
MAKREKKAKMETLDGDFNPDSVVPNNWLASFDLIMDGNELRIIGGKRRNGYLDKIAVTHGRGENEFVVTLWSKRT